MVRSNAINNVDEALLWGPWGPLCGPLGAPVGAVCALRKGGCDVDNTIFVIKWEL